MALEGEHGGALEVSKNHQPEVRSITRPGMSSEQHKHPSHYGNGETSSSSRSTLEDRRAAGVDGSAGGRDAEKALMKRTLVAQNKKIQQLVANVDRMETERESMRQQVDALRMAVFEASTRAEQTAEQCKRDAVEAAVREIAQDREAFAEGRREALKRIGELEDALEIALRAAGGVHKQLCDLGLSCEDLGKTSVHLSITAQEAPPEDKQALAVAGETIEAVVGVMRAMEGSGVFDILDPIDDDGEEDEEPETAVAVPSPSPERPTPNVQIRKDIAETQVTAAAAVVVTPALVENHLPEVAAHAAVPPQEEDADRPGDAEGDVERSPAKLEAADERAGNGDRIDPKHSVAYTAKAKLGEERTKSTPEERRMIVPEERTRTVHEEAMNTVPEEGTRTAPDVTIVDVNGNHRKGGSRVSDRSEVALRAPAREGQEISAQERSPIH